MNQDALGRQFDTPLRLQLAIDSLFEKELTDEIPLMMSEEERGGERLGTTASRRTETSNEDHA